MDLEAMRFGRGTVRENLARAIEDGRLREEADATVVLSPLKSTGYLHVRPSVTRDCSFLSGVLFSNAYDGAAVPYGCRSCYKVKAVPADLRGLVALRDILETLPYAAKCGIDLFNPYSRDTYAGFLYLDGLPAARTAWRELRSHLDAHPDLGPGAGLTIKRGCSHFEAVCGPSNRWTFREGMAALEETLRSRCRIEQPPSPRLPYRLRRMTAMVRWIKVAYTVADDTYLAFTGGRPLYAPAVSYSGEDAE